MFDQISKITVLRGLIMINQDNSAKSKLGQNWKTIAIVATILMVGAVMGHSLLTSDQADNEGTPAKQACQGCQTGETCADQEKSQANADAAFASVSESGCCAQKSTGDATTDAISESGCCAKKAVGDTDSSEMFQTSLTCCGCEPSTDSQ
jgi:hypothetical protein